MGMQRGVCARWVGRGPRTANRAVGYWSGHGAARFLDGSAVAVSALRLSSHLGAERALVERRADRVRVATGAAAKVWEAMACMIEGLGVLCGRCVRAERRPSRRPARFMYMGSRQVSIFGCLSMTWHARGRAQLG
jgi:hypothetical protein